ncbi:MAG: hypothetical protein WBV61_00940 [Rhodanobacteraceae bacterium]
MIINSRLSLLVRIAGAGAMLLVATVTLAAQPPGTAAASAAYSSYLKSVKSGDMDAVTAAMVPEKAAQMKAQKGSKDFPMMWGMFTTMHPASVKVTDAHMDGNKLVMTVETTQGDKQTGTIEMQQVGGKWLVGQESYKGTMGGG